MTALLGDTAQEHVAGRELQAYPSLSESFTPDHKPLMGEAPELRGFFLGCGFNSAGECGQQCVPDSLASLQVKTANWASPSVLRAPPPHPGLGCWAWQHCSPDRGGDGTSLPGGGEVPLGGVWHPRCEIQGLGAAAAHRGGRGTELRCRALGVDCRPVALLLPGMMLGGGCGQELAHWIIHGRPEKDMHSYDIRQVPAGTRGQEVAALG